MLMRLVKTTNLAVFVFLLGFLSILPLLITQVNSLWATGYMRFFPLAWLSFLFFVWRVPKLGFAAHPTRRYAAMALSCFGILVSLVAALANSPNLSQLAAILLISGFIQLWLGIAPWTRLAAFSALLWVTWPLPGGIHGKLLEKIQFSAISMASNILDLFNVPHFATSAFIDLRSRRIELELLHGSYDSVYTLLFLTILICIALRRPLFLSSIVILTVPVISWLGSIAQLLLVAWGSEVLASDWLSGVPLVILRSGVFVGECGLVWLIFQGLSSLFEPVMVDRAEQINQGIHGAYNRAIVWPLNFSITIIQQDEQSYFDDELGTGAEVPAPKKPIRIGPSRNATRIATDPWMQSRWTYAVLSVALLATLCSFATAFLPPAPEKPLTSYSAAQLQQLATADTLPEDEDLKLVKINTSAAELEGTSHVAEWWFTSDHGAIQFIAAFPTRGFDRSWERIGNWQVQGVPRRIVREDFWPVYEIEFADTTGKRAYGWYSAFDSQGNAYVPTSWWSRLWTRLPTTILGRIFGLGVPPLSYQTTLFLEANGVISERTKQKYRTKCRKLTQAFSEKTLGVGK